MDIQYALLGLLSWRPMAGYDLKKMISESDLFYWSGNNNQIYNSLVALHRAGLVSVSVQLQESLPAKKVYAVTEAGLETLRRWSLEAPELPEQRSNFLIQLAWTEQLSDEEVDGLLEKYEAEIEAQLRMRQALPQKTGVKKTGSQKTGSQKTGVAPNRSRREAYLWSKINERIASAYQSELDWVRQVREALQTGAYST